MAPLPEWVIKVTEPDRSAREIELAAGLTFGRKSDCGCVLNDPTVSGCHAEIVATDGGLSITDLGSSNKTRVLEGPTLSKGESHALAPGMRIRVGETTLEVIAPEIPTVQLEEEDASPSLARPRAEAGDTPAETPPAAAAKAQPAVPAEDPPVEPKPEAKADPPKAEPEPDPPTAGARPDPAKPEPEPKPDPPKAESTPAATDPPAEAPKEPPAAEEPPKEASPRAAAPAEAKAAEEPAIAAKPADRNPPARPEAPARPEKADESDVSERPEKAEIAEKAKNAEKVEKAERPEKAETAEKRREKTEPREKPERREKRERPAAAEAAAPGPADAPAPAKPVPAAAPAADQEDDDGADFEGTIAQFDPAMQPIADRVALQAYRGRLVVSDDVMRESIAIRTNPFTIGRDATLEPDLVLEHGGVSRSHAAITFNGRCFYLADMGSSNGTELGDVPLPPRQPRELLSDARVAFGSVEALFVCDKDPRGNAVPAKRYEDALAHLVRLGKLTAGERDRAVKEARERGCHAGEVLVLEGKIGVRDWCDALGAPPPPPSAPVWMRAAVAAAVLLLLAILVLLLVR